MLLSEAHPLGPVSFPPFTGLRVMMMPFRFDDPDSLSEAQLGGWRDVVLDLIARQGGGTGVGYLTIDEAVVEPGHTHRRPGLHVDGGGAWGGGPAYGGNGMILAANVCGARAWLKSFAGDPGLEGDCEHLRPECEPAEAVTFAPGEAWWCSPACVHEGVVVVERTARQLVRISFPSDAPYHRPYTPNATGVVPTTRPGPDRSGFMAYREE